MFRKSSREVAKKQDDHMNWDASIPNSNLGLRNVDDFDEVMRYLYCKIIDDTSVRDPKEWKFKEKEGELEVVEA